MNGKKRPDSTVRWIAHAIVGVVTGLVVGQKSGTGEAVLAAVAAVAAHEELDAPVANLLVNLGF